MSKRGFKHIVVDWLFAEERKVKLIKALNDNIDIPILTEKTEQKIFEAIWNSVEEVLKKAILEEK